MQNSRSNATMWLNKATKVGNVIAAIRWPLVLYLTVTNEACHIPNEDIPQATTTAVMKHFKMIQPTPMEVVLNFISLNFIKVYARRCKDSGCLLFFFSTYKSWHPEGTWGFSHGGKINKTSAISPSKSNLMRSNRGMCGRNSWTCRIRLCWVPSAFQMMILWGTGVDVWVGDEKEIKKIFKMHDCSYNNKEGKAYFLLNTMHT